MRHRALHAGSSVSAHDRYRLERLVRYVARPPLSIKRMTRREDGRIELDFHPAWSAEPGATARPTSCSHGVAIDRASCCDGSPRSCRTPGPTSSTTTMVHDTLADCVRCECRRLPVLAPAATWRPRVVRAPVYDDGTEKTRRSAWIPWATLIARVFGPGSDPMI